MNCSLGCMKCLVFVFNIVYAIVGVALLSMGTIFFTQELQTSLDEDATALSVETNDALRALKLGALFFLVKGIVGILLAILGCWGAIKESPLLMKVLAGVLIVLALLQIILSGISFAASNNEDILVEAKKKIDDNLQKYDDPHSKYKEVQHNLEEKYHCCGSNNYTDYKNIEIPKSCCVVPSEPCALKQKGCGDAVAEKIVFLHKTVGAVATILYLLEIIGAIGSYFLAVTIVNAKRRGTFT